MENITMESQDLRRGNIVTQNGDIIYGITTLSIHRFDIGDVKLNPVCLTKEWLLSFGFDKHEFGYNLRIKDDNGLSDYLLISLDDFECELYFVNHRISGEEEDFKYLTNTYFVHQLQNLYFVLVGHELLATKHLE
jgi:hypothetical protein